MKTQIPPSVDPSQVISGTTASGQYDYQLKDCSEAHGVIFTILDNGPSTTTLVHPDLSVTY